MFEQTFKNIDDILHKDDVAPSALNEFCKGSVDERFTD